jgi:hypothetical protein
MNNLDRSGTLYECAICGEPPGRGYRTCKDCAEEWELIGKPYKDWPEWIKALVNIERRNSYRDANYPEIPTDPQILEEIVENNKGILF